MCNGVSDDAFCVFSCSASAGISCIATLECLDASQSTQWTVRELLLNKAMCAPSNDGYTSSMTSHKSNKLAISKSELVMVPVGFVVDIMLFQISLGHWRQKTVGGTALFSPIMIPLMPCIDASFIPTKSGQAQMSELHFVGEEMDSFRKF